MIQLENVPYTAKAHTTSGRDGASRNSDGRMDVQLASPGTPSAGTNPEQLFVAGWLVGLPSSSDQDRRRQDEGHA